MTQININFLPPVLPRSSELFIVGGTVRDIVLGKKPSDYDIVTLGDPERLARQIAAASGSRAVQLGKPGMILMRVNTKDAVYDIVPAYSGAIESDLKHRDFTINAMAVRLSDGLLVDLFGGLRDINDKCIKMVSLENMISDPVRLLRAYRMGAVLNFTIDLHTRHAVTAEAQRIRSTAQERIRDELVKLLTAPGSCKYIEDMADAGILIAILPEMTSLQECLQNQHHPDDAFVHSLKTVSCLEDILNHPQTYFLDDHISGLHLPLPRHIPMLKFAALLHDIGKPQTRSIDEAGGVHFYNHEQYSARLAHIITQRLRFSNIDRHYITDIIANHMKPLFLFLAHCKNRLSIKAIHRFFLKCGGCVTDLLIHSMADMKAKGAHPAMQEFIEFSNRMMALYINQFKPLSIQKPVINGDDLIIEFGLTPSPLFKKILNHVTEQRLQNLIYNREQALLVVKKFLNSVHES
jgi:poly(A) polymerase